MITIPARRSSLASLALILSLLLSALLLAWASPAEAAKCSKKGTNGDDVLRGTKKNDVLCGRGGDDVLLGKGGKDQLLGAGGDDSLSGGSGADQLKGQGGADTVTFTNAPVSVVVNLAGGTATGEGNDRTSGVENATGSAQADNLIGSNGDNVLSGGDGADTLAGGVGDDTLDGGPGVDKANYFSATAAIDADLAADAATGQGADSLPGVENVTGSPQDDVLTGDSADNILHGGAGNDTVSFAAATAGVTVDLATDTATGAGADSFPFVENVVGSPQDDTLVGDGGNNAIDGDAGADTISYADAVSPVTVDLVNGTATGEGTDVLTAIEGAIGSNFADVMVGGSAVNELRGGDGNDALAGGAGGDQLLGENGNDQIYGEPQDDVLMGGAGDDLLDGGPGTDSCDGGPGTNQLTGGCDAQAPTLDDFSISPAQINTATSARTVTFTLELSDAVTGVNPASSEVSIAAPDGSPRGSVPLQLLSGDKNDGIYEATVTVPQYAPQGIWTVSLRLADHSGNQVTWSSSQLTAGSFPGSFQQQGPGDDTAPQLTDLSISPATINTFPGPVDVTFTLDVTDAVAGVDPASSEVSVAAPDGSPRGTVPLQLVSGDSYEATVTVPRFAPQGTWTVSLVLLDNAGNQHAWSSTALIGAGHPGTFEQTGPGDGTAPALTSFSLSPSQINTTSGPEVVTFDLHATDAPAGIDAAASHVVVMAPDGSPLVSNGLQLMSPGVYRATINVAQDSVPGTWTVSVLVVDHAGNQEEWSSSELIAAGFPGSFINIGTDPN